MRICSTSIRSQTMPIEQIGHFNCNDQIAARAFGAVEHVNPSDFERLKQFTHCYATMWKVKSGEIENRWMEVLHRLKDETDTKVVLFQEAETPWPTTRPWDEQKSFIELLGKVDLFLTHNVRDIGMWGPLRKGKPTFRWRTCLDVDYATQFRVDPSLKHRRPVIVGSSYDQRANGLAGLVACLGLDGDIPFWHQNRSTGYHDRNHDVPQLLGVKIEKEIPHSGWTQWLEACSGAYMVVHPMPAASAGRDQICFAAMGIPCIGSWDLDIQKELFPRLAIDHYDVDQMRRIIKRVMNDPHEYEHIRNVAISKVADGYGIKFAQYQAGLIKSAMGWE